MSQRTSDQVIRHFVQRSPLLWSLCEESYHQDYTTCLLYENRLALRVIVEGTLIQLLQNSFNKLKGRDINGAEMLCNIFWQLYDTDGGLEIAAIFSDLVEALAGTDPSGTLQKCLKSSDFNFYVENVIVSSLTKLPLQS